MKDLRDFERLLKPLANRRRLAVLRMLKVKKEMTVGEIAGELKLSMQATSHHLQILSRVDILNSEQRGLLVYYSLSKPYHPIIQNILSDL